MTKKMLIAIAVGFIAILVAMPLMMTNEGALIGVAVGFILSALFIVWVIRVALRGLGNSAKPVSTELLTTETVGIGRGASAAVGGFLGGNLGAVAGAVGGGRQQYGTFRVKYSNGRERTERVKVNTMRYNLYMKLRNK